jgi:hypothetical protein
MSDEDQVEAIKRRFAAEGYELVVHPVAHGGYFAPYIRADSRGGSAPFTWGATAVEAAEKAWAEFQHSRDEAAAAQVLREAGSFFDTGEEREQPRRGLELENDISRRDDPW